MKMHLSVARRVPVVVAVAVLAACSSGPASEQPDRDGGFDHRDPVSVDDLEDHVRDLPGVVDVEVERTEADSEYWVVGADVVVEDDIGARALREVVRVLGEAGPRVDGDSFTGSIRLERDAPRDDEDVATTSVLYVRDHDRDPGQQAAGFLAALDGYPEALVSVDGGVLSITGIDPRGRRVSEVLGRIAGDPALGTFPSTVVAVEDAVEGLPSAKVWVDEPLSDVAIEQWQAVVDVAATTPREAAPLSAYVLVRSGAIDLAELVLDGDLPDDVPPDFATWQPVLGPMIEELMLLGAANADPGGTEIDVDSVAGEFAGVFITDTAAPSEYGDPAWCRWAADVVNGAS